MNRPYDSRPRPPTRLAFHPSRIVIDAGVLLVLGAMSLPFVTGDDFRQRAVAGDALPALLLLLPVFAVTLIPDHSTPLPRPLSWIGLALAAAALPYTVVKYLDAATLARTVQGGVGMGARLLVLGTFTSLAGAALGLFRIAAGAPAAGEDPEYGAVPKVAQARRPLPAGGAAPARSGGAGRIFSHRRRSPAPQPDPAAGAAPEGRPRARVAPRPRPADPDTEPTVPAQRPVQPWWPDDLDDLFS